MERHIGLELFRARKWDLKSREEVAGAAALTIAQLAKIEQGRVPLRLLAGWRLCMKLDIHPNHLLRGGAEGPFIPEDHPLFKELSQYVAEHAQEKFSEAWSSVEWQLGPDAPMEAGPEEKCLTSFNESVKLSGVKLDLPNLRDRLKRATQERGSKSALARKLGVPLPTLSVWLSGKQEPGGAVTLQMLHWVEAWEAKHQTNGPKREGKNANEIKSIQAKR